MASSSIHLALACLVCFTVFGAAWIPEGGYILKTTLECRLRNGTLGLCKGSDEAFPACSKFVFAGQVFTDCILVPKQYAAQCGRRDRCDAAPGEVAPYCCCLLDKCNIDHD
ncbi:hypothetical protein L596_001474 [Steinernema carpocapsae]|uniref:Single domain-containing protein n=1 Tax=Steinernema carpocapsae TaxID=34508 RepID=A0A4U8UNX5_STECR|nr:hypothetical protein L596_001474 [Steinernema carpocapsae]